MRKIQRLTVEVLENRTVLSPMSALMTLLETPACEAALAAVGERVNPNQGTADTVLNLIFGDGQPGMAQGRGK